MKGKSRFKIIAGGAITFVAAALGYLACKAPEELTHAYNVIPLASVSAIAGAVITDTVISTYNSIASCFSRRPKHREEENNRALQRQVEEKAQELNHPPTSRAPIPTLHSRTLHVRAKRTR